MKYLKDNLWIIGLVVAVLLFLNIFIQSKKSHSYYTENQPYPANDLTAKLNRRVSVGEESLKPSLNLNLELLGTIIGNPSLAFISELVSSKYGLYKLNELVAGAKIVSITPGRVILDRDGLRQELLLKNSTTSVGEDKRSVIVTLSPTEMVVSKSGALGQMDKANELLAKVKISGVPDPSSDKLKGFRIDNIPSESIIDQAGIQSGDVICSVEGQRLESTQDAIRIFRDIRGRNNIKVDLLRNGNPLTLRYEIRD